MKIFGKFLLWVLAYALGAALIFFVARSPAPPINPPESAPQADAPAEFSRANEQVSEETSPQEPATTDPAPRPEASTPPAPAPDAVPRPSSSPRRVKAVRIPSR